MPERNKMKKKIEIWIEGKDIKFETSKDWTIKEIVRVLSKLLSEMLHSDKIKILYISKTKKR